MTGHCAQCRAETVVTHYRMADVGLRYLCDPCHGWMVSVGMHVEAIGATDPRSADRGRDARQNPGTGQRHISALMQSLRGVA